MKLKILLTGLVLAWANFSFSNPGAVGANNPEATRCYKDPSTNSGYKCYNEQWSTVPEARAHLNYALTLGNHYGEEYKRAYFGSGETEHHCTRDILYNNVEAANRSLWSLKCEYISLVRVKNHLYELDDFDVPTIKPIAFYPLYGTSTEGGRFNVHVIGERNMDYRTRACNLPAAQKHIMWCEAGCFSENQLFPYALEDIETVTKIKNAPLDKQINIYALDSDSDLDNLNLEKGSAWTVKSSDNSLLDQEIYEIYVVGSDDAILQVSGNHPVLNEAGEIVVPIDLSAGDKILSVRGPEVISKIKVIDAKVDMYNVLPESTQIKGNIFVMGDGYLVGSQRIQRKEFGNMKRAFYRESIEVD